MSEARTKRDVARSMIEECEHLLRVVREEDQELGISPAFAIEYARILERKKDFWSNVESEAALEYSLEGIE